MSLETALGYRFERPELLRQATTHRSYTAEHPGHDHNERLEFLGDAVLGLVVAHHLHDNHPTLPEGQLSKVRATAVGRDALAEVAVTLGVGETLRLGRGERLTGGHTKDSILADATEAIIGAIYLDGGFDAARTVVLAHWRGMLDELVADPGSRDHKSRLQELLAARGLTGEYRVDRTGPDHDPRFTARMVVAGATVGEGEGESKKQAQQRAALQALRALTE